MASDVMSDEGGDETELWEGNLGGVAPSGWNSVKGSRNVENDCHEIDLRVRGLNGLKDTCWTTVKAG